MPALVLIRTRRCPRARLLGVQLLEKQLKKVAADERKSGLDLSQLRAKIKQELAEVDKRL